MKTKTEYLLEKHYLSEEIEDAIIGGATLEEICQDLYEYYLVQEEYDYLNEYYSIREEIKKLC